MTVPVWFFRKKNEDAKTYQMFLDYEADGGKCLADLSNDDFVSLIGSVIRESEKAVYFWANTGAFGGSTSGFKFWIPKSIIK